jgi:3-isopropylmalate/(R)-2-methylmalate dehydratase small subunit
MQYRGKAHLLGDNINTDYIISSRRKRDTLDEVELSKYLMEDIDPAFAANVKPGDFIVAGNNFGCGSAMEIATLVVRGAGIPVILAKSFSRTYYRNCINSGILLVTCETSGILQDDIVEVNATDDGTKVTVNGCSYAETPPMPEALRNIIICGGLIPYMRKYGDFVGSFNFPK